MPFDVQQHAAPDDAGLGIALNPKSRGSRDDVIIGRSVVEAMPGMFHMPQAIDLSARLPEIAIDVIIAGMVAMIPQDDILQCEIGRAAGRVGGCKEVLSA